MVTLLASGIAASANLRLGAIVALFMGFILLRPGWRERTEAIALSDQELIYTSGDGETMRIRFADIGAVEETYTAYWYAGPTTVTALRIVLKSGETKIVPLAFPERREIVSRVRRGICEPPEGQ